MDYVFDGPRFRDLRGTIGGAGIVTLFTAIDGRTVGTCTTAAVAGLDGGDTGTPPAALHAAMTSFAG